MKILFGEARDLLIELIQNKDGDLADILAAKFDGLKYNEDTRLRGVITHLIDAGYLNDVFWASDVPYMANLTYEGEHYLELEEQELQTSANHKGNTYSIQTLNAQGSNLILGDAHNTTQTIDNSIHDIEIDIEKKGGEDKEELTLLLSEAKSIAEYITKNKTIPQQTGFFQRVSNHLEKHGWFYGAVVQLIGSTAISLL